ncbi:hypothetical protein K1T71_003622 [Dendrolimus kikuchii]|uniref:Uncharacterized protein n=1 Tax=Dendrolimus kikuchii TaxID=765133 RepID=A0ACC1D8G2_9NEOP|nr:hypothetical protein K1T71_003622 [Dendrolimus kikuchii]
MSNISKRRREGSRAKIKSMGDHKEFLRRITKTLYYGQLPTLPCLSLPVTEVSCELWSVAQRGRSLRRLHADAAAGIARSACVSPCALVLAILYLERLNSCNPDYIAAAAPADLFLVSLMVGNKFLQDDGEDDDVMCSEWAASGGIDLKQLNKLEVEFLDAIDWNVFVSEKSFEVGLLWLERQVALKQAQLRGFFTYTDLIATCDGALLTDFVTSVSAAWLSLTLGYVSSLMTLLTSALVVSHTWLPTLHFIASRTALTTADPLDTSIIKHNYEPELYVNNATLEHTVDLLEEVLTDKVLCCSKWSQYKESVTTKKSWYDTVLVYDWKFEPWWSKTVHNWLYQSSLINPMQRWLEKINEYADIVKREFGLNENYSGYKRDTSHKCVRQWLNLSKLSMFAASMSDR